MIAGYGAYRTLPTHDFLGTGVDYLLLATVAGWIALNFFGFYQNGAMRRQLEKKLSDLPQERVFVGCTSPKYTGLLDAHEDVGFLVFGDRALVFVSETKTVDLARNEIKRVMFRPNVHSLLGLGRWIAIEGAKGSHEVRMMIEPRERNTMLGNVLIGGALRKRIEAWRRSS